MSLLQEHVEHRLKQALIEAEPVSGQRIEVVARQGRVTLRGKVHSYREKLSAQTIVAASPDVSSVNNLLEIEAVTLLTDQRLAHTIRRALAEKSGLTSQSILVEAIGGKVTLTGYAATELDRVLSSDITSGVAGVHETENLLFQNPDRAIANEEHCYTILAALKRVIGLEKADLQLGVVDESAQITGIVDQPWKKEVAETTIRRFKILKVANDLIAE